MRIINANTSQAWLAQPEGFQSRTYYTNLKKANFSKLKSKRRKQSPKETKHQEVYLAFFPIEKPLSFLVGSILPLLAQNLSTPILMTLPKFFTTSSLPDDKSTFSKILEVFPLRLFELLTCKHRKQSPPKKAPHRCYKMWRDALGLSLPKKGWALPDL